MKNQYRRGRELRDITNLGRGGGLGKKEVSVFKGG